jgi:tRNA threonylcarbamoyladenosine biosynthesis protein TsaB
MAVAEDARWQMADAAHLSVTALLDARMDELYAASYFFDSGVCSMVMRYRLIKPENLNWNGQDVLAGNVFAGYGARLPEQAQRINALPTAQAMLRLAPALLAAGGGVRADQALPTYIRDKVAQTTLERTAAKETVSALHG